MQYLARIIFTLLMSFLEVYFLNISHLFPLKHIICVSSLICCLILLSEHLQWSYLPGNLWYNTGPDSGF